jgi:hypothetical protein
MFLPVSALLMNLYARFVKNVLEKERAVHWWRNLIIRMKTSMFILSVGKKHQSLLKKHVIKLLL